jgi:D-threonate/D-erythronate kinase
VDVTSVPQPRPRIGVVADDLTGAADTAVGFRRSGMSALVSWADWADWVVEDAEDAEDAEMVDGFDGGVDVLAIDSGTRALDPGTAERITRRLVTTLRAAGVRILYKKADSLLRGHLGVEVKAALTAWEPGAVAIVAMAFPGTGRTTVGGRVLVDGHPIDRPPIARLLTDAGLAVTHAERADVRGPALAGVLAARRAGGSQAIVCDAETDEDLRAIAVAGSRLGPSVVWVGSGGLAAALGGAARSTTSPAIQSPPTSGGPVLVVVGSTTAVARAQVAHLAATGSTHVTVPLSALGTTTKAAPGPDYPGRAGGSNPSGRRRVPCVAEVEGCLHSGRDVVVTLGAEPERPGAVDDVDLARRLGRLLQPCAPLVGGLVATGGDTATGVLRAWGTTALRLVGEVEPGVPLSFSVGPRPIPVVTKAGAFGDPGTLAVARARLEALLTRAEGER